VAITDDEAAGRAWIDDNYGASRSVPRYQAIFEKEGVSGPGALALVGDEAQVERQLRRYEDAGVTDLLAVPFGSPDEVNRTLEGLGSLNRAVAR
jgi:alkanesulfonate monooxygenase SsuD/methylene tetrahydromethanopterin reductase-like flavin-dependent oxidoreductase (luciferase family)